MYQTCYDGDILHKPKFELYCMPMDIILVCLSHTHLYTYCLFNTRVLNNIQRTRQRHPTPASKIHIDYYSLPPAQTAPSIQLKSAPSMYDPFFLHAVCTVSMEIHCNQLRDFRSS